MQEHNASEFAGTTMQHKTYDGGRVIEIFFEIEVINRKRQETREFPIKAIGKEDSNILTSSQVKSNSDNKYKGYRTAQKKQYTF